MNVAQTHDAIDKTLLDSWQRDFPLVSHPFAAIGQTLGLNESEVIARLRRLTANGVITRVGATVRPNTVAASTLAAIAVPPERIDEIAAIIGSEQGVNHSYLREHHWNMWFVATAPDIENLQSTLARIETRSGLRVLDLRLLRAFNIDLGFSLTAPQAAKPDRGLLNTLTLNDTDRRIMQTLSKGLPLTPQPFADLAHDLAQSESDLIARIKTLSDAGYLTRIGVIVRHRALGWSSNAMVVWRVPVDHVVTAGEHLAALPGVTLCYQRKTVLGVWPYTLYSMIHARSRTQAHEVLEHAKALPALKGVSHEALFSTHCFKQTGAMIAYPKEAAS